MEIKFEVKHSFNTARQMYQAQITLYLPQEPNSNGAIHHLLKNNKTEVFGEQLISNWGWGGEDKTTKHIAIEREKSTTEELKEVAGKIIDETIPVLRSVYQNNVDAMASVPKDLVYVFNL